VVGRLPDPEKERAAHPDKVAAPLRYHFDISDLMPPAPLLVLSENSTKKQSPVDNFIPEGPC